VLRTPSKADERSGDVQRALPSFEPLLDPEFVKQVRVERARSTSPELTAEIDAVDSLHNAWVTILSTVERDILDGPAEGPRAGRAARRAARSDGVRGAEREQARAPDAA